jgi:hypothetical protein
MDSNERGAPAPEPAAAHNRQKPGTRQHHVYPHWPWATVFGDASLYSSTSASSTTYAVQQQQPTHTPCECHKRIEELKASLEDRNRRLETQLTELQKSLKAMGEQLELHIAHSRASVQEKETKRNRRALPKKAETTATAFASHSDEDSQPLSQHAESEFDDLSRFILQDNYPFNK